MDRYPNIEDHGLIGDLHTAALVTTDGTIDFFCCPRFDSPSVFASLLDADRGGHFRITPDRDDYVSKQLYFPDTAILITRFLTPDGVGEVHDFMPIAGPTATDRHRLVRQLKVVRGTMRFAMDLQPRFDYARKPHKLEITDDGAVFQADGMELTVHAVATPDQTLENQGVALERQGDGMRWTRTLREGQTGGVVLEWMGGTPRRIAPDEVQRLLEETAHFWRGWLHQSRYTGRWRGIVNRSAMTLKLMTYRPTGAIVAAPTAGLPEQAGGERNWDYRYTWIRDGSFSIYALLGLGYTEEAAAFAVWLRDRASESAGSSGHPLKIMYRVDGSSDLVEETLDHFEGWRGSRPVRIGNGAADQLQLDIYGEAMDSIYLGDANGLQAGHDGWTQVARMIDWLVRELGPAGRGHLGDPRRPEELHLRPVPDLGRARPRHQDSHPPRPTRQREPVDRRTRPGLQPDHGTRVEPQARRVHPALRHRGAGLLAADDAADGLHRPARPDVAVHAEGDGPRAGLRQPGLPLQPQRVTRRAGRATRARSRCARSGTSTPWPAPGGSTTRGWSSRRCRPTPTTWVCSRRRSAAPATSWATSRRRSATCR